LGEVELYGHAGFDGAAKGDNPVKLVFLFLAVLAFAADKQLPESEQLKLRDSYKSAIILQQQVQSLQGALQQAQGQLNKAVADYRALEAQEAKENGFEEGTTFTVDVSSNTVTAVKPEKKATEKK
jgi:hypothetical protein